MRTDLKDEIVKSNMASTREMVDMVMSSDHGPLHPHPRITSRHVADFQNINLHPHPSNSANFTHPFVHHSNNHSFYGSQHKVLQSRQPFPNMEAGYALPNVVSNPFLASSSGGFSPLTETDRSPESLSIHGYRGPMGNRMNEYGDSNQLFDDTSGWHKRKIPEEGSWIPSYQSGAKSGSSSSNPGMQYRNVSDIFNTPPYFAPPEQQNDIFPMDDGCQNGFRSRSNMFCFQREPSLASHQNHLLQENFMGHSFHPTSNTMVDHFVGSVGDAGTSNWNYLHAMSTTSGRSSNRGSFVMENYGNLCYQDFSSSRNPAANTHILSIQNRQHHLQALQGMHACYYNQVPAYGNSVYPSVPHGILIPSRDFTYPGSGFPRPYPAGVPEQMYGPSRCVAQGASGYTDVIMGAISPEDAAVLQFSGFRVDDLNDHHRDMRMDIDDMSYEELLALQEQIGDVKTGLSEENILKHLKIRLNSPFASLSLSIQSPSNTLEDESCTICQVEFEENERIGTLDCGHDYHADCIKQWLLIKNLCPICKTTAIAVDTMRGPGK